jgi:hypothetical protein
MLEPATVTVAVEEVAHGVLEVSRPIPDDLAMVIG